MTHKAFLLSSAPEIGNEALHYHEFRNLLSLRYEGKYVLWFLNYKEEEDKSFEHCPHVQVLFWLF